MQCSIRLFFQVDQIIRQYYPYNYKCSDLHKHIFRLLTEWQNFGSLVTVYSSEKKKLIE